jgi:hypothetical protein
VAARHRSGGAGAAVPAGLLTAVSSRVLLLAVRLAAVTLAVAAAGLAVPSSAQAATCSTASGVSVVVDFHQLGGGVQTYCDAGGAGKYADVQFADAGHELTYVSNEPFVCRVDGAPASDPCVHTPPTDAYWSLWWSDGTSGTWSYSSSGVASLKVPAGGYVALSWQQGNAKAAPGAAPTSHRTTPTSSPTTGPSSTPHPTTVPSQAPPSSSAPSAPVTSGTPTPTSSGTEPTLGAKHSKRTRTTHAASHDRSTAASHDSSAVGPAAGVTSSGPGAPGGSGSGGVPGWVAPVVIAVLFAGAGALALVRRRTSGGPR